MRDKTNWDKLKNRQEKEILANAKSDPDLSPLTTRELKRFKRVHSANAPVDVRAIREK